MFELYPSFRGFKEFFKDRDKPMATWRIVILYPFALIGITILILTIRSILTRIANSERRKYPSEKYRKVVKKGLFWDTTEYHER